MRAVCDGVIIEHRVPDVAAEETLWLPFDVLEDVAVVTTGSNWPAAMTAASRPSWHDRGRPAAGELRRPGRICQCARHALPTDFEDQSGPASGRAHGRRPRRPATRATLALCARVSCSFPAAGRPLPPRTAVSC